MQVVDAGGAVVARLEVGDGVAADVGLVDVLARLRLWAARRACAVELLDADEGAAGLLDLCGLADLFEPR